MVTVVGWIMSDLNLDTEGTAGLLCSSSSDHCGWPEGQDTLI